MDLLRVLALAPLVLLQLRSGSSSLLAHLVDVHHVVVLLHWRIHPDQLALEADVHYVHVDVHRILVIWRDDVAVVAGH